MMKNMTHIIHYIYIYLKKKEDIDPNCETGTRCRTWKCGRVGRKRSALGGRDPISFESYRGNEPKRWRWGGGGGGLGGV